MLDFISNCKQTIIKYKKQLLTFAMVPVFMFLSSLSGFATNLPLSSVPFCNSQHLEMRLRFNSNGSWSQYYYSNYEPDTYYTNFTDNIFYSNLSVLDFGINMSTGGFEYPYNFDSFDYYFTFTISSYGANFSQFSFVPSSFSLGYYTSNLDYTEQYFDFDTLSASNYNAKGFTLIGKLPDDFAGSIVHNILVYGSGNIVLPSNVHAFLYQVPKNSSSEQVVSIIQAINNQTNTIMNAGSGFGGTTSGILSGNDELSGFIDDYTEIEQSMYDKFTENQSAVIGNFSGFSWGSLSTAVDWTSDYLNRIYDNSGDFRTMFMYPILAGIALIFIGRQGLTAYVRSRREK